MRLTPELTSHNCPLCGQPLSAKITAFVSDHVVSEIEYECMGECGVVGYWAYGHFHPDMPYQG